MMSDNASFNLMRSCYGATLCGFLSDQCVHSSSVALFQNPLKDGSYEADRQEVDRRQGPEEAVGDEGSEEVCAVHRRSEEAPSLQARHSRSP